MEAHDIGGLQKLVHGDVPDAHLQRFFFRGMIGPRDDLHPDCPGQTCHFRADMPGTDNTQCFTLQVDVIHPGPCACFNR